MLISHTFKHMLFLVWNKFVILKVLFAGLTLYLIYDELFVFLFSKPTFTSIKKGRLKPNQKPDIIICPQPGFDNPALLNQGYDNSFWYSMGSKNRVG